MLARIQHDLFDVGADLCVPGVGGDWGAPAAGWRHLDRAPGARGGGDERGPTGVDEFRVTGGGVAHAHVARGVVRRAERRVAALSEAEQVNAAVVRYLNRLSDHLFVLARRLNAASGGDVLWTPGLNR